MERYGCSRMTVSKALSSLSAAGLIERRKRAGSFVAPQTIDMAALAIPDIRAEIEGRGARYGMDLLNRRITPDGDGMIVGETPGSFLRLTSRHLADGRPFAIEHRIINLTAVPEARAVDFTSQPPGSWLLANIPWTQAENRIAARLAGEDADALACDVGAPCLCLDRRTWRAGEAITSVRQIFSAAGFNLIARFSAAS
ncbi:transcriptional regulator, GntR family [Sphingomonas carotinifaciens]|nr:transcriptional regulator, GntR family [Sphingomonas carotinifaciens]